MDRKRFVLKSAQKSVEVFFLDSVFIVDANKIFVLKDKKLVEGSVEELNKSLSISKEKALNIKPADLDSLKSVFGEFDLGY